MRVLVTGVAGFCGSHLISRLRQERSLEVAGLDRAQSPAVRALLDNYFQADIVEAGMIDSIIRAFKPDCIYHLAGASGAAVPSATLYEANVIGVVRLLDAARTIVPDCKVLITGSSAEYGPVDRTVLPVTEETPCNPLGPYGVSKYAATLIAIDYARRFGLRVVIARPSNILGAGIPESLFVGALLARVKNALASPDPHVKVGDFDSRRDFIDVHDVTDAYIRLIQSESWGQIFNISSGESNTVGHVAQLLLANSSRPIKLTFDSDLVPLSNIRDLYCSYEKAQRTFGFRPTVSLQESLRACWMHEIGHGCVCA